MREYKTLKLVKNQKRPTLLKIAIGVRVKNEIEAIKYFWDSITKQTYFKNLEILFIDSGSTDGTLEFLNNIDCHLYTIESKEFSFGDTCNLLMSLTKSDYVCFFSGHVILESNQLIEYIYNFINTNPDVSGYFRQIPNHLVGCSIYDRTFLKYKYRSSSDEKPVQISAEKNSFSNAASFVCREHWNSIKFKEVVASEDYLWAKDAIDADKKLLYFHMLNVQHSHNESHEDIFKRVQINARVRYPNGLSRIKITSIYLKVFIAIFFNTFEFVSSLKFARAHAAAYKI